MWFPTRQRVIDVHDRVIETTGGEPGILRVGAIDAAISRATHGPFGGDGDLFVRAALLFRGIVQDHPFIDGNKRTAYEVTDLFLEKNELILDAEADEIVSLSVDTARGRMDVPGLRHWFKDHARSC